MTTKARGGTQSPTLEAGAVSLSGVLMQAITHIAPAIGLATSIAFVTSLTGITAPLAYGIAFVLMLTVGASLTRLARLFPSAGGYYTYLSRTIHPRAGLLTSWVYFLYDPLGGAINLAFFGFIFQGVIKAKYGVTIEWWIPFLVFLAIVTFFVYRGIKVATGALVVLGVLEILVVVALALSGLLSPGPGGATISSFDPARSLSGNGLYLAVVFSILTFSGFESVAPLAEESRNPRRTLPIAIITSIAGMGVFFVVSSWGIVAGWGAHETTALANSAQNPMLVIGERLWGAGWLIVLLAIFNSALAVGIACTNASTRVFYGMARSGSLPRQLAKVHPRHKTPVNAVLLQTLITLAFGLGIGFWIGPDQEFFFTGVAITLGLIFIYCAGNIGVTRYYVTQQRSSLNFWLDILFPVASTVGLVWVGYKSIIPLPTGPAHYAPFVVLGWFIAGIVLVWYMSRTGREAWLVKAREAADEVPER